MGHLMLKCRGSVLEMVSIFVWLEQRVHVGATWVSELDRENEA